MSENRIEVIKQDDIIPGFGNERSFELAQRAAKLLSQSNLVPKEYQGNLPNCVIALNMASRMNADPLMVMQNLYVVYGRPSWSGQFLISTFNTSGKFSALRYEWLGEEGKDSYGCRAWAIEKATGEKLVGSTVTVGLARKEGWYQKNGSKWQTMPQQMLMYRAASWFIRAYAPELAMGMHTVDEAYDIGDKREMINITPVEERVEQEIEERANAETIDIVDVEEVEEVVKKDGDKPKPTPKAQKMTLEEPGF